MKPKRKRGHPDLGSRVIWVRVQNREDRLADRIQAASKRLMLRECDVLRDLARRHLPKMKAGE